MPWRMHILPYLPQPLANALHAFTQAEADALREIRLRAFRPVEWVLAPGSRQIATIDWIPEGRDIADMTQSFFEHSTYAHQEDVRQGYLTLRGGHRVGLCGRVMFEDETIRGMSNVSSLCLRIARPILGVADWLMPLLIPQNAPPRSSLLFSAPGLGKTTLLRDAVRQLSDRLGQRVCVVDERSEIAGCAQGISQMDVGQRTDVLDACPKVAGMMLMLRAMSPQWLVVDEIGKAEDADALIEAALCGVPVLASAHASSIEALLKRPMIRRMQEVGVFTQYVGLKASAQKSAVWDADGSLIE